METNYFRSRTPEELAQFYSDLFVLEVDIEKGGNFSIEEADAFVVSVYKNQDGAIIGAMILDIPAAASFSGALSDLPEDLIQGIIQSSEFTKEMWEDLYEVLNISSQLFTSYEGDTIAIEEVYHYPKSLPSDAYEILRESAHPLLFRISISEYGGGYIAVLDAGNNSVFAEESQDQMLVPSAQEFSSFDDLEESIPERPPEVLYNEEPSSEDIAPQIQYVSSNSSSPPWLYLGIGLILGGIIGAGAYKLLAPPSDEIPPELLGISLAPTKTIRKFPFPDTIKQVRISNASYTMGCNREFSEDCGADEYPSHKVTIPHDFYIMKHEVTQELYEAVTGFNPSRFFECGFTCPVENVSWKNAALFANKLSEHHSLETCYHIDGEVITLKKGTACLGYRLPTEAEWEYAARGPEGHTSIPTSQGSKKALKKGEKHKVAQYAGSQDPTEVAWYGGYETIKQDNLGRDVGIGKSSTHPVCKKKENGFGLCDMSGNVWEWTQDTYRSDFYSKRSARFNPIGTKGRSRVLRGGSWLSSRVELRTSHRFYASENTVDTLVPSVGSFGFRLVRTAPDTKELPKKEEAETDKKGKK